MSQNKETVVQSYQNIRAPGIEDALFNCKVRWGWITLVVGIAYFLYFISNL